MGRSLRHAKLDKPCGAYRNWRSLCQRLLFELNAFADIEPGGIRPMWLPLVADESLVQMEMAIDKTGQHKGMTLIVVDQMAGHAIAVADRAYLLQTGAIVKSGTTGIIAEDPSLEASYLGGEVQAKAAPRTTAKA